MWCTALRWFVASGIRWVVSRMPCRCIGVGFRANRPPAGSGHGVARNRSEASTSLIRTARRGIPRRSVAEEDACSSSGSIRTRGRTRRRCSTAPRRSSTSCGCAPMAGNGTGCWRGRHRSSRGCGRSRARPGPARCWPSNSSPPARRVLDVPPTLVGSGAAARHRPQRQDRQPRRPLGGGGRVASPVAAPGPARGPSRRCCGCWPNATTTSSPPGPGRSVGSTRRCATWPRATSRSG